MFFFYNCKRSRHIGLCLPPPGPAAEGGPRCKSSTSTGQFLRCFPSNLVQIWSLIVSVFRVVVLCYPFFRIVPLFYHFLLLTSRKNECLYCLVVGDDIYIYISFHRICEFLHIGVKLRVRRRDSIYGSTWQTCTDGKACWIIFGVGCCVAVGLHTIAFVMSQVGFGVMSRAVLWVCCWVTELETGGGPQLGILLGHSCIGSQSEFVLGPQLGILLGHSLGWC